MMEQTLLVTGVALVFLVVGYCMGRASIDKPVDISLPQPSQDTMAKQPATQFFKSQYMADKPKMKRAI